MLPFKNTIVKYRNRHFARSGHVCCAGALRRLGSKKQATHNDVNAIVLSSFQEKQGGSHWHDKKHNKTSYLPYKTTVMEEFEVNIDGSGTHRAPDGDVESTWWAGPSSSETADQNAARKRNRARRRRSICIVLALLVVCGVIAAIVLPTTLAGRTNVVSAVTDGSNTEGEDSEERTCNGLASNCFRRVNEIMYPTGA